MVYLFKIDETVMHAKDIEQSVNQVQIDKHELEESMIDTIYLSLVNYPLP